MGGEFYRRQGRRTHDDGGFMRVVEDWKINRGPMA